LKFSYHTKLTTFETFISKLANIRDFRMRRRRGTFGYRTSVLRGEYAGGHEFKSRSGDQSLWLSVKYLKLCQDSLLTHLLQLVIQ